MDGYMDIWFNSETGIKNTTKIIYRGHIENHINPMLGEKKLRKITTDVLQNFVSSLSLAPSTVKVVFSILKAALIKAEEKGYIENVWSKVKLPKNKKSEVVVLTISEQKRLEEALSKSSDIGVLICLYMGLRIGELCALKWENVDLERSVIKVKLTQVRTKDRIEFISPKSNSSYRTVPIPDFLNTKLKKLNRKCEFVLSEHGNFIDVRTYRRRFKSLLKKQSFRI